MDAIQLLHELVCIQSLSGQEQTAVRFLTHAMNQLGYDQALVDEAGNAVGIRTNGNPDRQIVLLGHIDTVPGDIPVRIEDGMLHGRGTVDAKGSLATFVMAGARAELPPNTQLVVIGAVEEESATSKGARFVATQYQPDYCIIGEPSNWDAVTLGYKGRVLLDVVIERDMGHTAGEVEGVGETAVFFYHHLHTLCQQWNAEQPRLFDQLLPSLRHIQTSSDGLTNRAELKIGVRLPPNFDLARFQAQVEGALSLSKCADSDAGFGKFSPQVCWYAYEPAYQDKRTSPLARTFNRVLRGAGIQPRFKLKTGTSDMNVVAPIWQCPTVAYGPGDSALDHTPQEQLSLNEYQQAINILQEVIETL